LLRASFNFGLQSAEPIKQLGVSFDQNLGRKISYSGQKHHSFAAIASSVPVLYIGADSHFLWQSTSKQRRSHLDWGVFHVEHSFLAAWREFNTLLAQYNSGLKNNLPEHLLVGWREQLAIAGELVHTMRNNYLERLNPQFSTIAKDIGNLPDMILHYNPGWDVKLSLLESMQLSKYKDRSIGHCQVGAHRCDLHFARQQRIVKDELSQGQMKLLLYALKLAQAKILQQAVAKKVIYLIDDLPSELDIAKQQKIMDFCTEESNQVFVTAISQMIHVKHQAAQFNLQTGSLV
jgi:DNA replication and repair protein RecF